MCTFLLWLPQFLYTPIFITLHGVLGGNYSLIGFILCLYGISQLLLRIPVGIDSDVFGLGKPFVIFVLVSIFTSCLIFFLTDHLWMFLVASFLAGVVASCKFVLTVIYTDYHEKLKVNKAILMISLSLSLHKLLVLQIVVLLLMSGDGKYHFCRSPV